MVFFVGGEAASAAEQLALRTDIGLSQVDNTRDLDKPVSTATQAALVAQTNAIQEGIQKHVADSDAVDQPHDGSTYTGLGTGGSGALQALADTRAPAVMLRAYYDPTDPNTGSTILDGTVRIPNRRRWQGEGGNTKFVVAATDPYPDGYFLLNTDANYQSASAYSIFGSQDFGGMYLDGRAAADAGKKPVGVVVGGPGYRIHDIYTYRMQTALRGALPGGSFLEGARPDQMHIDRVNLNDQPVPVDFDPANPSQARYGIDFLRVNNGGDGIVVERCQSNVTGTGTTSKRCRFIGFRGATSLTVRHIINGDVYLYQSDGALNNSYFESGKTTVCAANLTIADTQYWMRNELTYGTDVGCTPIEVISPPSTVNTPSQTPSSLALVRVSFNYDASRTGGLGGYSLTNPNFYIDPTALAFVRVNDCWRAAPYTNAKGSYQRLGITCGQADFDNYSHFASVSSYCQAGGTGSGLRWTIEASRGPIALNSATTGNVIEQVQKLSDTGGLLRFKSPAGRYFYRGNVLLDKLRGVGIAGALETYGDTTLNGGALELRLGFDGPSGGMMVRVFRGYAASSVATTQDSFTHYVDVPIVMAARLDDCGADLASFVWKDIPSAPKTWAELSVPGGLAAVNVGLSGGLSLRPGERTTGSDAYGRVVAYSLTGTLPTTGSWRRNDEVHFISAVLAGTKRQTGWRRLTNCTSASPTHVAGVDWVPMYAIEPPITPGVFGLGSTASLTVATGQTRANVAPTGTNLELLNVVENEIEGYWYLLEVRAQSPGSFAISVKKSTGSTSSTISASGLYIVAWRQDLLTWEVGRLRGPMGTGAADGGATGLQLTVPSASSAATYPIWAERILVSSATTAVTITMPADAEIDGTRRRISVTAFTNAISLAKGSSGTVTSTAINATGEWEAIFSIGVWKATKLGELPA